ncbi:RAS oncogene family member Rab40 [Megalopta genalis]|uniref:RAS oncogene family member Rab40 n=1 Tax=Megalopta genalis TaxID=115081 RepID=UPI0014437F62|nr:ras-related protein Rab-40C [Megalopta genalis]
MAAGEASTTKPRQEKQYDYLLKFLLVGDSDVGKQEILSGLEDGAAESPFCSGSAYKTTTILLDGKRVKLQLWDTSGQGRFCTIIRSYSRGAQGIILVYDITNKWSFDGIDRWLKEVEEHAPGVPKVLVGNRLHLAFKRRVGEHYAKAYAAKNHMAFFEVSPLCNFNIRESFSELSRMALHRNGMERLWRSNKVLSLQELACRAIVARTTVYGIDQLPLPKSIKSHLKSYAMTTTSQLRYNGNRSLSSSKSLGSHHRKLRFVGVGYNGLSTPGSSPIPDSRTSCVGRNSCAIS